MLRPSIPFGEGLVGDLADHPLHEAVLAALGGERIRVEDQDLAADEAIQSLVEGVSIHS